MHAARLVGFVRCLGPAAAYAQPAASVTDASPQTAELATSPSPNLPPSIPARADATPAEAPEPESYRWQIAVADLTSISLGLASAGLHSRAGLIASSASYVIAGCVVHALHRRPGRAAGSALIRLGAPISGASIGFTFGLLFSTPGAFRDEPNDDVAYKGAIAGFGAGIVVAMIIDAAALARDIPAQDTTTTWAPQVSVTNQRVGLGIAGQF